MNRVRKLSRIASYQIGVGDDPEGIVVLCVQRQALCAFFRVRGGSPDEGRRHCEERKRRSNPGGKLHEYRAFALDCFAALANDVLRFPLTPTLFP
jgi:hypothetical protein